MPFHFLALELTLSHQMSGDHKTLIIYGLLLKSTIICRTDLTMTPGVSSFHRHAFGSAFHSLNSLQPLLQCCPKNQLIFQKVSVAPRGTLAVTAVVIASNRCAPLCQRVCQAFHMLTTQSSQWPLKVGPIGTTISNLQVKKPRFSVVEKLAPGRTANKGLSQRPN